MLNQRTNAHTTTEPPILVRCCYKPFFFTKLKKMTEQKLSQAEKAIEYLADALGITEQEVVSILREGMEAKAPIANQLPRSDGYFISEMEATFGVF